MYIEPIQIKCPTTSKLLIKTLLLKSLIFNK